MLTEAKYTIKLQHGNKAEIELIRQADHILVKKDGENLHIVTLSRSGYCQETWDEASQIYQAATGFKGCGGDVTPIEYLIGLMEGK